MIKLRSDLQSRKTRQYGWANGCLSWVIRSNMTAIYQERAVHDLLPRHIPSVQWRCPHGRAEYFAWFGRNLMNVYIRPSWEYGPSQRGRNHWRWLKKIISMYIGHHCVCSISTYKDDCKVRDDFWKVSLVIKEFEYVSADQTTFFKMAAEISHHFEY